VITISGIFLFGFYNFDFDFREDSGKNDSDLDEPWIMTVRGPNSLKPLLNSTPESSSASPSQLLSKKTQQNGSLQSSKKSSNHKSNVESNVTNNCFAL